MPSVSGSTNEEKQAEADEIRKIIRDHGRPGIPHRGLEAGRRIADRKGQGR